MRPAAVLLLPAALALAAAASGGATPVSPPMAGVPNPAQARVDYMLKCQGCHRPDGTGNVENTPPLAGVVAQFLSVPGGREFVARVPGVAMTDLDERRLAQLLNWTLHSFDGGHVPADFRPYTAEEIARFRKTPLRLDRVETRRRLLAEIEHKKLN